MTLLTPFSEAYQLNCIDKLHVTVRSRAAPGSVPSAVVMWLKDETVCMGHNALLSDAPETTC